MTGSHFDLIALRVRHWIKKVPRRAHIKRLPRCAIHQCYINRTRSRMSRLTGDVAQIYERGTLEAGVIGGFRWFGCGTGDPIDEIVHGALGSIAVIQ